MKGHSFQIDANAAFRTPKAQDGENAFRTRYFGRRDDALLPHADRSALICAVASTNDKSSREASPTRRRLSHIRPGPGPISRNPLTNVAQLTATHLPDRYGRKCG